jgi:ubiquinone/menaquinone biosynthesis C-methylase UbiE
MNMPSHTFYTNDTYITHNPNLHTEDSAWKTAKILPLIDILFSKREQTNAPFKILDVGGGAGIILKDVASYITSTFAVVVEKHVLDLSPGMVDIQRANNPDLVGAHTGSVTATSFTHKEFDLVLMIDVIEHVPKPELATQELSRIAKHAIFKVPLESCLLLNMLNIISRGKVRQKAFDTVGHVNFYTYTTALRQVAEHGVVVSSALTNVFEYFLRMKMTHGLRKMAHSVGYYLNILSPRLASLVVNDFLVALVTYPQKTRT